MKTTIKIIGLLSITILFLFTSCRTEETQFEQAPENQILVADSPVAKLMQRTSTNDGSNDNIIDNSNCFNVQLPVTVTVNGTEMIINTEADFAAIESIFDEFDDDNDDIQITFPITVILADFTEIILNNASQLDSLSDTCNGENESDDDIECIDFQYPITASIFNSNNELINTVTINNDHDMHDFLEDIDVDTIVNVDFPITVIIPDGSLITINNFTELAAAIETYKDTCDEDDDNDYNDDDCDNCTSSQVDGILTGCTDWTVDKLELNDVNHLEDNYVGYSFVFSNDGTITVTEGANTFAGTWSTSGTGNNILITIDIPALTDFNNTWNVHEVEQEAGESKVDLRLGDDRLRFESTCI
jgi:hypothetical protein